MHYEHPHNNSVTFHSRFSTEKNTGMCYVVKVQHVKLFCYHICFKCSNIEGHSIQAGER